MEDCMTATSPVTFGDLSLGDKFIEFTHAVATGESVLEMKITPTTDEEDRYNCVIIADGTLGEYPDDTPVIKIEI